MKQILKDKQEFDGEGEKEFSSEETNDGKTEEDMGHGRLDRLRFGDIEKQRLKTCISCYVSCSGDPKDSFQSWTCSLAL